MGVVPTEICFSRNLIDTKSIFDQHKNKNLKFKRKQTWKCTFLCNWLNIEEKCKLFPIHSSEKFKSLVHLKFGGVECLVNVLVHFSLNKNKLWNLLNYWMIINIQWDIPKKVCRCCAFSYSFRERGCLLVSELFRISSVTQIETSRVNFFDAHGRNRLNQIECFMSF